VGSNRGYEELVPHHIHVVNETRQYAGWQALVGGNVAGIITARRELAKLHSRLGLGAVRQVSSQPDGSWPSCTLDWLMRGSLRYLWTR